MHHSIRGGFIAVRVGRHEFLIFLEYNYDLESPIEGVYGRVSGGVYKDFAISVSMGVASTQEAGCDYDSLFRCADQALYVVKHSGKKGYYNYYHKENAIDAATSAVSPIDAEGKEESE